MILLKPSRSKARLSKPRSARQHAQMLQQDLQAQRDQGHAADQLDDLAQPRARRLADQKAQGRQGEGGEADAGGDQPDVRVQQGQADPDRAGVDRGADGGGDQGQQAA